jgi:TRAP-type C4-dicarboxylate transport system permease small subunit
MEPSPAGGGGLGGGAPSVRTMRTEGRADGFLRGLRAASDRLDRAVVALCVALFAAMLLVSLCGIAWQIATGHALAWSYPVARMLIPWIAMLSVTCAFKRGEHIAMSMLLARVPPPAIVAAQAVGVLSVALFALALAWTGAGFFAESGQLVMVSDTIQVSDRWMTAAVPISGLVLLVHIADGAALLGAVAHEAGP